MQKIVINRCYGGFGLSLKGLKRLAKLKGKEVYFYKQTKYNFKDGIDEYCMINDIEHDGLFIYCLTKYLGDVINELPNEDSIWFSTYDIKRDDTDLIRVVEELDRDANGSCSNLEIVEIPDDVEWEIEEYDGNEWVAEEHRTWG